VEDAEGPRGGGNGEGVNGDHDADEPARGAPGTVGVEFGPPPRIWGVGPPGRRIYRVLSEGC
jgi:hypothetical protein